MTRLVVDGLTKRFGRFTALRGIDLEITDGEFLGLFGPNGAGKSTLIRVLATLSTPTEGSVRLDGAHLGSAPDAVRGRLGVLTHDTMLYDELTARENVRLHARLHGVDAARCEALLDRVGLAHRASERPVAFSHGMCKRLSLARALVHDPDVLLLDEPYAGLDRRAAGTLGAVLDGFDDRLVVMATHDFERGFEHCDRAVVLGRGQVRFDDAVAEYPDTDAFERAYRDAVGLEVSS
ncbi:ABC transporter ATP-binding protein [Halorientalis sp. IM1011]|uniref:ABC transporter ATP-binding protein n=1 Tax=Halorientalis sp. IM1011 TaxID=1932360 RepID=UPI00097CC871|nr:ABC transporter ATP-binding protein [Halorientalis sp. IM1011]AQL42568.1 ABC transporter ATP-binding protein [Halorientalis sp. IM1011]